MNENMVQRKQFSTRLPPDLVREVRKQAIDEDRRLQYVIEEAITDYLKRGGRK